MTSAVFHIKEHILPCQHIREYARATAFRQEDVLKLAIKQYTPIDNPNPQPGDVTIIGAHANGFPKELYEPLWLEIHTRLKANGFGIRSIWMADVAHQGASGALNEHLLGDDPSWLDLARDLLHAINHFRAEMPLPIIGFGHSMGACSLVNLSLMHPRLFTTVILIEPVINAHVGEPSSMDEGRGPASLSTFRRDIWPSRAAAAASFRKQKFYQAWDPRVFDLWIEHGLRPTPTALYPDERDGVVTLSTTKAQEVWTFLRPRLNLPTGDTKQLREAYPDFDLRLGEAAPFYRPEPPRTFEMLPHLRPSTLFIFGEDSFMASPRLIDDKVRLAGSGVGGSGGAQAGRVKAVTVKGTGHLLPMEVVGQCADLVSDWAATALRQWQKQQLAYDEWTKIPLRERMDLSDEWKAMVGGPPAQRAPAKAKM